MVVLAVTWIANPGKEEEVADAFRKLEAAARQEPGCLRFVVHRHRTDHARFCVYEQYRDDAALAAHLPAFLTPAFSVTSVNVPLPLL